MVSLKPSTKLLIALTFFSIAMAYLEGAVVVYLRMNFYPEGFNFPLKLIPVNVLVTEVGREASTIVMLVAVGYIVGKNFLERFSFFIFCFGVWDIFYYVWLKFFLNWPPSLLTYDILFLIPLPWIAPVLAPVIVSASLIVASVLIIRLREKGRELKPDIISWMLVIFGGIIIVVSFLWSYFSNPLQQSPSRYLWEVFLIGEILGIAGFIRYYLKLKTLS